MVAVLKNRSPWSRDGSSVSAEDAVELSDLRDTTRSLMRQMEADLGTRLDWIAVDHHNTSHSHTHILLRGVTDDGKTLSIAGDYIAHGVRERASEIVTLELGRLTEQDVSRSIPIQGSLVSCALNTTCRLDMSRTAAPQGPGGPMAGRS